MSVSTFGELPWSAIAYYIVDENLDIYFISGPEDLHIQNLENCNKVTCTIYDSTQINGGKKIGIQYSGECHEVRDMTSIKWMVKLWIKLIAGEKGYKPKPEDMLDAGGARVYKITPKKIKFYNSRDFKEKFRIYITT